MRVTLSSEGEQVFMDEPARSIWISQEGVEIVLTDGREWVSDHFDLTLMILSSKHEEDEDD